MDGGRSAGKRKHLGFCLEKDPGFAYIHYFCLFFGVNFECGRVCSKVESECLYFFLIKSLSRK